MSFIKNKPDKVLKKNSNSSLFDGIKSLFTGQKDKTKNTNNPNKPVKIKKLKFNRTNTRAANETIQNLFLHLKDNLPEVEENNLIEKVLKEEKELHVLDKARKISIDDKKNSVKNQLQTLEELVTTPVPKGDKKSFFKVLKKIDKTLTDEAAFEKIRQLKETRCPSCQSYKIKRRGVHPLNPYCHTYLCELCGFNFDDLTGSGLSSYVRSIRRWVLCWYYLGFDLDPETLAEMMGVSIDVIEKMIDTLNIILPLTHPTRKMHYKLESEQHLNDEEDRRMYLRRLNRGPSAKK